MKANYPRREPENNTPKSQYSFLVGYMHYGKVLWQYTLDENGRKVPVPVREYPDEE